MKKQSKTLLSKISQAGSMMVEAMAMLALISLVTPTLYKKSAERTTELQDINTATHLRTLMKAADSYVSANYEELLDGMADGGIKPIDISTEDGQIAAGLHDYFPYGYEFGAVKNFEGPKLVLKRQGMSITSFVELPKKTDIGDMRAARIASMVGSNGGYVDADGNAQGVGGVWSLDSSELNSLGLSGTKGSIVVASSDAINSATSGALENEKYLQRTKPESTDQLWRNTMVTDLYMGGVTGADNMHKILGVDQLILGSTNLEVYGNHADLVLTNENGEGSAWMAGTLSALSDSFTISGETDAPEMAFGMEDEDFLYINNTKATIFGTEGDTGLTLHKNTSEMETNYATTISNTLDVTGSTKVASGDTNTTFQAGPDGGSYITAEANTVKLLNNSVEILRGGDGGNSTTNINTTATNISGDTTIGTIINTDMTGGRGGQVVPNPKLSVQGSAFVHGNLEVGQTLYARDFNTLTLHAGGTDFNDQAKRWLHATDAGVSVTNPNLTDPILQIDTSGTELYGPTGYNGGHSTAVILGERNAQMRGVDLVELYTEDATKRVVLQDGSLVLTGQAGGDNGNQVDFNADTTTVNDGIFRVTNNNAADDDTSPTNTFYVNPDSSGEVTVNADTTTIRTQSDYGIFQVVQQDGDKDRGILSVGPDLDGTSASTATLDKTWFRLADSSKVTDPDADTSTNKILEVNLDYDNTTSYDNQGSIYIRRGAIEVEKPSGSGYDADSGYGYIETGRFVSNAIDTVGDTIGGTGNDAQIAKVVHANDAINPFTGELYDRYMVNPAYTSVMHDIKLTTRGGARLSDILPDFINKGIYVVNNSYRDKAMNLDNITVSGGNGGRLEINEIDEVTEADEWASPFMGVVPAPQCPPGHARVITITPAGFQMSQAGQLTAEKRDDDGYNKRYAVNEYQVVNKIGQVTNLNDNETITGAQYTTTTFRDEAGTEHQIYYLGHGAEPTAKIGDSPYSPQPLYFQQSTWLKSKVVPHGGDGKKCSGGSVYDRVLGGSSSSCEGFKGWATYMGFLYPGALYHDVITAIVPESARPSPVENYYFWNVFPVRANTLEAYATVYCYFDRTNLYSSGNDDRYVDPYDQLNEFREGYDKPNSDYVKRLNDPTLKYTEPW